MDPHPECCFANLFDYDANAAAPGIMNVSSMQDEQIIQSLNCAFCFEDLKLLTLPQREAHYELHFLETSESESNIVASSTSAKTYVIQPKESSNRIWKFPRERDTFWYPKQITAPPSNFTPGLIPLIRKGLLKGQSRQLVRRAVLCDRKAVHIHREVWDANWGCGYRNFMMACASLMCQEQQPLYLHLLDTPSPPSVRNLQSWIESAWKDGFDPEGHEQLKKLVGTSKWIGTSDLWVAFTYIGIPVELVDFDLRNNPQGQKTLLNWIVDYFSVKEASHTTPKNAFESLKIPQITMTEKMPLILQHDGHSRTIIGYEIDKNGVTNLLTFDPGFRPTSELRTAALNEFAQHWTSTEHLDGASTSSNYKRNQSNDIVVLDVKESRSTGKNPSLSLLKEGLHNGNAVKEPDLYAMIRNFRLDPKRLSRKKEYQILYFPMTTPLTDYEKSRRRKVTCTKLF